MKMEEKEIEKLIKRGESRNLEFKESLSVKDEIGESISAFSNSCNGKILIGISNSGEIKGVQIGEKTIEGLANFIKQNTDNSIYPDIKVEKINNKNIIIIEVKEADEKPVFFRGKAYKRIGNSNHKLSASEIRKMAKESTKSYWDEQICEEARLEDIDENKVMWFLKKAREERGLKIEENISTKEILMKLRLLKNEKLTNTAILLFGKEPQKFFLQAEAKCIRFKGNKPVKPYIDFQTISGSVFDVVNGIEDFVLKNIKKAIWLIPGKIERAERYEYPSEAIREAVVNAVAHRDYESVSKIQVRIFDDYLEIWNPGKLPEGWTVEKLKQKHESIPKNPLLFKQLSWVKYVEDVGGGTLDMIEKCKEWNLPEPEFEFTGTSLVVSFAKSKFTEEYLNILELNNRQKEAINYINEKGKITRGEYEKVFAVHERQANRELKQLLKLGLIERQGSGYKVYYILSRQKMSGSVEKDPKRDLNV
jgi:ATP-dependent DNA helicase RecG